jgi:cation diffusion facilitator CzcD-associated flavoprotein CzcO
LKTQNAVGTYEYSEFPMDLEKYGLKPGQHIPGTTMHRYLVDYAVHHSLTKHIRLNTDVDEIEKLADGRWRVHARCKAESRVDEKGQPVTDLTDGAVSEQECSYVCDKIVCSTGLSSTPNPVRIPGMESFEVPILSASDLTTRSDTLVSDPNIGTVTVIGGSKTAYDSVATLAAAGKKVNWVIRKSGMGPLWMTTGRINVFGSLFRGVDPASLTAVRFFSWFSPCVWGDADGFGLVRWCLNRTGLGRWAIHRLWEGVREKVVDINGYRKHPELQGLEPDEG